MQTHVKALAILHIVFGALGILLGLGGLALFGGIAGLVGMNEPAEEAAVAIPILGAIGGLILLFALIVSIPGIITGIGMLSFKPWSRILGIVISILQLFNFPLGTGLGFYGLWVLFSRDGAALFERPPITVNAP
jgi:hypothetical protein